MKENNNVAEDLILGMIIILLIISIPIYIYIKIENEIRKEVDEICVQNQTIVVEKKN